MNGSEAIEPLTGFAAELAGDKGVHIAKSLTEQEAGLADKLVTGLPVAESEQVKSELVAVKGALHIVEFLKNFYHKGD